MCEGPGAGDYRTGGKASEQSRNCELSATTSKRRIQDSHVETSYDQCERGPSGRAKECDHVPQKDSRVPNCRESLVGGWQRGVTVSVRSILQRQLMTITERARSRRA